MFACLLSSLYFLTSLGIALSFLFSHLFWPLTHITGYLKCIGKNDWKSCLETLSQKCKLLNDATHQEWLIGKMGYFIGEPSDVNRRGSVFISWLVTSERISLNLLTWKETWLLWYRSTCTGGTVTWLGRLRKKHSVRGALWVSSINQFLYFELYRTPQCSHIRSLMLTRDIFLTVLSPEKSFGLWCTVSVAIHASFFYPPNLCDQLWWALASSSNTFLKTFYICFSGILRERGNECVCSISYVQIVLFFTWFSERTGCEEQPKMGVIKSGPLNFSFKHLSSLIQQ